MWSCKMQIKAKIFLVVGIEIEGPRIKSWSPFFSARVCVCVCVCVCNLKYAYFMLYFTISYINFVVLSPFFKKWDWLPFISHSSALSNLPAIIYILKVFERYLKGFLVRGFLECFLHYHHHKVCSILSDFCKSIVKLILHYYFWYEILYFLLILR